MKALLLVRVSTGHQDLVSQTQRVKEEALRDGYKEKDIIIIEDVESAVKLSEEERNGLNRLKQYIENDSSINCVYTYEISRISRRASVVYSIRDFLISHHVQLIVMNPFFKMLNDDGTLSDTSNIFFGIFGAMAENEGMLRKARIKKAVDKYRSEGRHTGGNLMFGYDTDIKHHYILHKENANIVRKIFFMYVNDKMSIRAIAKELWEQGTQLWTCNTPRKPTTYLTMCTNVNNILHRKEYIGQGKPRIITDEIYYKAQEIMKNRTVCATRKDVGAILRGMIYNKANGLLLSANAASGNYYSKRVKGPAISFECADKIIWEWVVKKHEQFKSMTNDKLINKLNKEQEAIEKKIMQQYNRKMELLKSIDRLEERIVIGKISAEKADEMSDKLQNEIDLLDKSYIKLQEERINIKVRLMQIMNDDIDLNNINKKDKINLIHQMINKIYIERIDRISRYLNIDSKLRDEEILKVDTYHKNLIK